MRLGCMPKRAALPRFSEPLQGGLGFYRNEVVTSRQGAISNLVGVYRRRSPPGNKARARVHITYN
jgi:hypothetical protein